MTTFTAEVMAVVCYAYETMLPFAWEEIAATGTPLSLTCDDCYAPIPEPFPFRFYGIDRTQVWVSSNGGLYFESRGLPYGNAPIPTGSMNTLIAPFWDDLYRPSVYY
ncbi:MAG: hypothetical protein GTO22_00105, partial [Gemmatimonadales bacterium]|nr:hypothetical protein [Gemmatimonadales bacterium]